MTHFRIAVLRGDGIGREIDTETHLNFAIILPYGGIEPMRIETTRRVVSIRYLGQTTASLPGAD